jgi:ubiquitin C-terminal hydrolase
MRGLVNLGNTCYFNTAVQCLAHVPPLSKFLFEADPYDGPCDVTREYQKVARQLFLKDVDGPVNPGTLLAAFRTRFPAFAGGAQHDAQEVIVLLIDVFEKSIGQKFIKSIFNGQECQETVYPGGVSKKTNEFVTLILGPNEPTSLEKLVEARLKHTGIEGYVDDSGQRHHVAAVRTVVTQWPRVFGVTFSMYDQKFPIEIPQEFQGHKLFAAVIHQGIQWGGHYALLVRRWDKWYIKDDETVTELNEVPKCAPFYMAWYRS